MDNNRLKNIICNYVNYDAEASESSYVLEVLRDVCGCSDEEIREIGLDWLLDLQ